MTKKRVTIKDIARVANVTPQTVSRAFRNAKDISEDTKQKILKIATEMGYVKNSSATSLRGGASKLIAIIYDNLMNSYFSIIIHYLQIALKEKGYSIMAVSVPDTHLKENNYLSVLEYNVDAIISFLELSEEIHSLIKRYNVPVLVLGRKAKEADVDCIYMDDISAGKIAAQKLIDSGCVRPLCINEALEIDCARDRYLGFIQQFEKQGIEVSLIANTLGNKLELEKPLVHSLENYAPDGIFCFNDMLAFETLYIVEKNGYATPKVIGADNIQQEIYFPKRLTTVGWDKEVMVRRATDMIINRINNPTQHAEHKVVKVFLVEGETA